MEFSPKHPLPGVPMNLFFPKDAAHCSDDANNGVKVATWFHGA